MKNISILKLLSFSLLIFLSGCSEETYTRSNLCFDTVATITLYSGGSEELLDQSFSRLEELDKQFDAFSPESEINQISTDPTVRSEELTYLLKENLDFAAKTGGYFSPTLGTLIELWNINEPTTREPPSNEAVLNALAHTDISNLSITDSGISLADPLEKINLGASVKGYASDLLKQELIGAGVSSALINLGGNINLIGSKEGKDFTVGIENPIEVGGAPIATVELSDKSIVTSGSYQRYFTDSAGNTYHHILDPHTGYPADSDLLEVTVVSDSSLEGDMLSTALFAMGSERAQQFLNEYDKDDELGTIFVTKQKEIILSDNLKDSFKISSGYEHEYSIR